MPGVTNIIVGSGAVGCKFNGNAGAVGKTCGVNRAVRNNLERGKGSRGDCWWTGAKTSRNRIGSRHEAWADRLLSTVTTSPGAQSSQATEGCREHSCRQELLATRASSRKRWRARRSSRSATGVHQQERDLKERTNPGMSRLSCKCHRNVDQSFTTENAEHEWKVQCVTTQLEPNVLKNPRDGNVKWRQDQTCSWVRAAAVEHLQEAAKCLHLEGHDERPKMQCCRVCETLQTADLSSLHGEMMPLGELSCETSEVTSLLPRKTCGKL